MRSADNSVDHDAPCANCRDPRWKHKHDANCQNGACSCIQFVDLPRGTLYMAPGWGKRLGLNGPNKWMTCVTCGTSYPVIDGDIRCNGRVILNCPFCTIPA